MAFVQAMNSPDTTKVGVNGADVYTEAGVGDHRVTLFTMLNRDLELEYIRSSVDAVVAVSGIYNKAMRDLFVMAFQTRDIRGGKGERKLFYNFMRVLAAYDGPAVKRVLELVPEYGCWRDMWEILGVVGQLEKPIFEIVKYIFRSLFIVSEKIYFTKINLKF
jgi:hypothetical protein